MQLVMDVSNMRGVVLEYCEPFCERNEILTSHEYIWVPKSSFCNAIGKTATLSECLAPCYYELGANDESGLPTTLKCFRPILMNEPWDIQDILWDKTHPNIFHYVGAQAGNPLDKNIQQGPYGSYLIGRQEVALDLIGELLGETSCEIYEGQKVCHVSIKNKPQVGKLKTLSLAGGRPKLISTTEIGFAAPPKPPQRFWAPGLDLDMGVEKPQIILASRPYPVL